MANEENKDVPAGAPPSYEECCKEYPPGIPPPSNAPYPTSNVPYPVQGYYGYLPQNSPQQYGTAPPAGNMGYPSAPPMSQYPQQYPMMQQNTYPSTVPTNAGQNQYNHSTVVATVNMNSPSVTAEQRKKRIILTIMMVVLFVIVVIIISSII